MNAVVDRSQTLLDEHGPGAMGFYTTGQLFCEQYYTLTAIARAGIGINHLDGNTRLCTATAGEALKETFGSDGQPASYTDVDSADVIALFGHNVAETQPVLWMRMLDRLAGPQPPRLLVVDPRRTPVAEHAAIHLAPRPGTNLALLNALLHELIAHDWVDHAFSMRTRSGTTSSPNRSPPAARTGRQRFAGSARPTSPPLPSWRARPIGCWRPSCRASTSRIRRPPPQSR
jgi:anaerobic selenocysteine-containing dehydrogenase